MHTEATQQRIASRQQQDHRLIVANTAHMQRVLPDGVRPTPSAALTPDQVRQRIAEEMARHPSTSNITAEWGQGAPILRSADGVWSFKPRGQILLDGQSTTGSRYGGRNVATTGARALRLGVEGGVGSHFFYQFETDFAGNAVQVLTAFMDYRGSLKPWTYDLRLGSLFNDRGFSGSNSSDVEPFLERNVVASAIIPQRGFYGVGVQGRLFGSNWHVSTALTGNAIGNDASKDDSRSVEMRAHYDPVRSKDLTLHLGAWGFYESLPREGAGLTRNATISSRFDDNLRISTGPLPPAQDDRGYGVELGAIIGPAWVMGEAGWRAASLVGAPQFRTRAYAVSGGYYLFGAKPPYVARTGNFTQPHVRHPFFTGGPGALELSARYDNLAFLDIPSGGGKGWAATLGGNWYLNDFVRLMLNGVQWHTDNKTGAFRGPDSGRTVEMRAQVSF